MMVHIDKLQNLKDEELLSYVTRTGLLTAESYCSAKVRELNTQFNKENDERDKMLLMGYGERHPVLMRLQEQHNSTREQLYAELLGMRDAMVHQLDVKKAESANLTQRYEEAKKQLKDKTLEDQKVKSALQEYAAEKARFDKLENDYIADKMRMLAPAHAWRYTAVPVWLACPPARTTGSTSL